MSGADTGASGTIALATSGGTYQIISIAPYTENGPAVDASHLETTTHRESIPGDLVATGEFEVRVIFNCAASGGLPVPLSAAETITITYPKKTGVTTAANMAGTGFVTARSFPQLALDTLMEGTFTVKFDGYTGPTFSAES